MRALTVLPGKPDSGRLDEIADPPDRDGSVLVRTLALGICGTDREIVGGEYGAAPPGEERLVLGHESLGEVAVAPPGSGLQPGDLVVGVVRRPDPVPCPASGAGEWDMCRNGRYTERGIKERHGYGAEYFRLEPEFAIPVDRRLGLNGVLLEPTSIVAKAWDHVDRIGNRARSWQPETLLVTGAGPIGLLAALIGAQRGLDVHVFDHGSTARKPDLVRRLGATFHGGEISDLEDLDADVVLECTGAPSVVLGLLGRSAPAGIMCLAGLSGANRRMEVNIDQLNRTMVLRNDVVFGSVNANRRHYEAAGDALAKADPDWLAGMITRRVAIERWPEALEHRPDDIKVVIEFGNSRS
jgi:threonine dehydrogenase-like Zn-dependent dehydrogenase